MVVSISVSARSLAAARLIDPDVSTAAVQAAIEAAVAADRRENTRNAEPVRREHNARREPGRGGAVPDDTDITDRAG